MKKVFQIDIIAIGLAIFSMFFGAGNLMYPLKVGMVSGEQNFWGMFGFLLTAVLLPLMGLITMILFDGDYEKFFYRLGVIPGKFIIYSCMLVIGPLIGIPRIVTLSHTMLGSFLPEISSFIFALLFLGTTFLLTFRESKIVEVLGKVISPALVASLAIIIFKGFFCAQEAIITGISPWDAFKSNILRGYATLDLLGGIFFASIVINILKSKLSVELNQHPKKLTIIGLKAGLIGTGILGLIYIGMSFLGIYYGQGLENVNVGELFRDISLRVLGHYGAAITATAVLMACLSTAIALGAVVSEFLRNVLGNRIKFTTALVIVLLSCLPLSTYGLDAVIKLADGPITFIGYPILIATTFMNIGYKFFGIKAIKIPVFLTGLIALIIYLS